MILMPPKDATTVLPFATLSWFACTVCTQILKWVQKCCAAHPMSGQVCFDFMLNEADNILYCIECESSLMVSGCRIPYIHGHRSSLLQCPDFS